MFITLNHKLFLATGDGKYVDVLERGMYNNAIDGVSAAGHQFFYVNRLASAGDGRDFRWEHASLECCPPNLVRFLAGMPGLVYAQGKNDAIYVNLFASSEASFIVGGKTLGLSVDSAMPWGGKTTIRTSSAQPVTGAIKLRIPGWARNEVAPGGLYRYSNAPTAKTTGFRSTFRSAACNAGVEKLTTRSVSLPFSSSNRALSVAISPWALR